MKLLVIGSGMMGSAAAYDMARRPQVQSVTLADNDGARAGRTQDAGVQPGREDRGNRSDGFESEIEGGAVDGTGEARGPEQGRQPEPRPDRIRHPRPDQAMR